YELDKAARPIGAFIDDLSTWYLRRSRERIKSDVLEEKEEALGTLRFVLLELSKVMAPFTPFFAEYLFLQVNGQWSIVNGSQSVHLENWPFIDSRFKIQDSSTLTDMEEVRKIVSLALEARARANVKVRQPLASLFVKDKGLRIKDSVPLLDLIKDEVNVKAVSFDSARSQEVALDTALTPELIDEGQFRELLRMVQETRKKMGFKPGEFADLMVKAEGASRRFVEQHGRKLMEVATLRGISFADTVEGETFQAGEIVLVLALVKS
ncbi:MAG: isoleucyl-tRNA synthetase, partial [Parcubacteria group bacterium Greene0416_79]